MKRLEEIDENLKVETKLQKSDIKFYSVLDEPFTIYGVKYENGRFRRMPEEIASSVSDSVGYLSTNTSGGRVRFKTDSSYVAISSKMCNIGKMDHFAITGSGAFDMYVENNGVQRYNSTFRPPFDYTDGYEGLFDFKSNEMREITINFPLYSDVCQLYIGLEKGAKIEKATPYAYEKPIVYYGSSITQGACASRPGNAYPCIVSRELNSDFVNLGFSGSARGEQIMADYIASLDMGVFVYDYDHNAPNAEHLLATHENMYKTIREKNKTLPIIMMSTTSKEHIMPDREARREIIYKTYENAVKNGDENVYFWDGMKEFGPYEDFGTVEGCHLNDLGFFVVAKSLIKTIREILNK